MQRRFGVIWMLAAVTLVPLGGCLDPYEDYEEECMPAPDDCLKDSPDYGTLWIRLSKPLPETLTVYAGDYEDRKVVWSGVPSKVDLSLRLPHGAYSAAAEYRQGAKKIIAVDGATLGWTRLSTCDGICYRAEDGTVDLELEK
jgi:hypothetical protein